MAKKELSEKAIKHAIMNNYCPICGKGNFLVTRSVIQFLAFTLDADFSTKRPFWGHIHRAEQPEKVVCGNCNFEIPKAIWGTWLASELLGIGVKKSKGG